MGLYLGTVIGGFIVVWVLQFLIDWALISRILDDPIKGKLLATILAFFGASLIYLRNSGSFVGFAVFLPAAVVVGLLEYRGALKVQARIDERDEAATFE